MPRSDPSRRALARGARPVIPPGVLGGGQGPLVSCGHARGRPDVPTPRSVTPTTRLAGHRDHVWFDLRRLTRGARVPPEGTPRPAGLAAAGPWLALTGRALSDDGAPLTGGTV